MSSRDVLQRPLDAAGLKIRNLGTPAAAKDATFTDNETAPQSIGKEAKPGTSFLADNSDEEEGSDEGLEEHEKEISQQEAAGDIRAAETDAEPAEESSEPGTAA